MLITPLKNSLTQNLRQIRTKGKDMEPTKAEVNKIIIELGKLKTIPGPGGPYVKYEDVLKIITRK